MQRMQIQTSWIFFTQNRIFLAEIHYIQVMMTLFLKLYSNYDTFSFSLCLDHDAFNFLNYLQIMMILF